MRRVRTFVCVVAVAGALAWSPALAVPQSGHDVFQKALIAERADGNLQQAVVLYDQIVRDYERSDRALVAKALVQAGACYEKLGSAEAESRYQRVVHEFADLEEVAGVAARRLAALAAVSRKDPLTVRQVLSTSDDLSGAFLTSDGRFLAFPDSLSDGPAIRDLQTDRVVRLTSRSSSESRAITTLLSPDRRQVAYSWADDGHYELRLIANEPGSAMRVLLSSDSLESYFVPKAWWPDSRSVLVERRNGDRTWQFLRVPVGGGNTQVLYSLEWRRPVNFGFRRVDISPDGRYLAYSALAANPKGPEPDPAERVNERIYLLAVDGSGQTELTKVAGNNLNPMWTPDGSHVVFLSDRTGVFDLWAIAVENGRPRGAALVLKRDVGKIIAMGMSSAATYRYYSGPTVSSEVTFARLDQSRGVRVAAAEESLVGSSPRWSPDGGALAVLRPAPDGSNRSDLVVHTVATGEEQRFRLPGRTGDARPMWFPDGKALLMPVFGPGGVQSLYRADLATGECRRMDSVGQFITGGNGLRGAISPDGRTVYVRGARVQRWDAVKLDRIVAVDLETGADRTVVTIPSGLYVGDLALSSDGLAIAFLVSDERITRKTLVRVGIDGSDYREVAGSLGPDASGANNLWWSGDSRSILLALPDGAGHDRVVRVPSEGGVPEFTGLQVSPGSSVDIEPAGSRVAVATTSRSYELWEIVNLPSVLNGRR